MILSKVYEDAERRLERNEITLGEFERLVDIEVIEPKRGEWIRDTSSPIAYKCTACNTLQHWSVIQDGRYHFCPNCGARMKGADDDTI